MLATWVFFELDFHSEITELGRHAKIAEAHVPIAGWEKKYVWSLGMILYMCDNLSQFFDIWRFKIHKLISQRVIFQIPHVHAQIVCANEAFTITTNT